MKDKLFYELQKSIKEGGKILKGKKKPDKKKICGNDKRIKEVKC